MQSCDKLISKLRADFTEVEFEEAERFGWRSKDGVVTYVADGNGLLLLHELAHALLGHEDYTRDVELVRMEAEAWGKVREVLAPKYGVNYDEEWVEKQLDTYREWIDKRSRCPKCDYTGWQMDVGGYRCPLWP